MSLLPLHNEHNIEEIKDLGTWDGSEVKKAHSPHVLPSELCGPICAPQGSGSMFWTSQAPVVPSVHTAFIHTSKKYKPKQTLGNRNGLIELISQSCEG